MAVAGDRKRPVGHQHAVKLSQQPRDAMCMGQQGLRPSAAVTGWPRTYDLSPKYYVLHPESLLRMSERVFSTPSPSLSLLFFQRNGENSGCHAAQKSHRTRCVHSGGVAQLHHLPGTRTNTVETMMCWAAPSECLTLGITQCPLTSAFLLCPMRSDRK